MYDFFSPSKLILVYIAAPHFDFKRKIICICIYEHISETEQNGVARGPSHGLTQALTTSVFQSFFDKGWKLKRASLLCFDVSFP